MIIIDVRESLEFQQSHVDGAINMPLSKFADEVNKHLANTNRDEKILVYCLSGGRANAAQQFLKEVGFTNVINGVNQSEVEKLSRS